LGTEKRKLNIDFIRNNITAIDWKGQFSPGISILGGEVYCWDCPEENKLYLDLVEDIIEKILKVSPNPYVKYSTVTNGMYDPNILLYPVVDKIKDAVGMKCVDVNFSYDLKYRYWREGQRELVLKNIQDFRKRYDYKVGVQMILAQYVVDMWENKEIDFHKIIGEDLKGCHLAFLYPHDVNSGINLPDFFLKRKPFLRFISWYRREFPENYMSFYYSTMNSGTFKYTGLFDRAGMYCPDKIPFDVYQQPVLSDGKEILNPACGHSTIYTCYQDSDKCLLCDLMNLGEA